MFAFQHITTLLAFVYALAVTHLFTRVADLLAAHARVRFSGLLALEVGNAVLLVFSSWLSLWDLRTVPSWSLWSVTVEFLYAASVFFTCGFAAPRVSKDCPVDLDRYFWDQRPYFYGSLFVCGLLAMLTNTEYLATAKTRLCLEENLPILPMLALFAWAFFSRKLWVQWLAGLGFFAMLLAGTVVFTAKLD